MPKTARAACDKGLSKDVAVKGITEVGGCEVTAGNVKYRVTDAKNKPAEAYGVKSKNLSAVTIADTVKVKGVKVKVTSVADHACKGMTKLGKVTIGKNVTLIGKKAFYGAI